MKTKFESKKLEHSKAELKALLERLMEGYYQDTAEEIFHMVAHTGVETDQNPELKEKPTFEEFMNLE